jgi:hypothetical protein
MRCKKYFYLKKHDDVTGDTVFQLLFIYELAQSDLNDLLKSNRKNKRNFSEK